MMIDQNRLARAFVRNVRYLEPKLATIGHEDSLRQPGSDANCVNWTLGHIAYYRDRILDAIGAPSFVMPGVLDRYARESEPILADGPGVLRAERLAELLVASNDALMQAVGGMSEEDASREIVVEDRATTLAGRVFFWYFHDTLHTGQVDAIIEVID